MTLFASGDSRTGAKLVPMCPKALRLNPSCREPLAHHIVMVDRVAAMADQFDVIHFHTDYLHFPCFSNRPVSLLTPLHGRLDLEELATLYRAFPEMPVVSISDSQRLPIPSANWVGTVYHGLPASLYRPGSGQGGYLAFLGRISPEKRPDLAIEIAIKAGLPLRIAAKVDKVDEEYFHKVVEPLLDHPLVRFVGEIGEEEKGEFIGNALAILFPIDWPEPFGLTMIEAMANGTPTIALRRGAVPEVIDEGETGWIVDSVDEAVAAVSRARSLDRSLVRQVFERRFSAERMARNYIDLYGRLIRNNRREIPPPAEISPIDHVRGDGVRTTIANA